MKDDTPQALQIGRTGGSNFLISICRQENHSWQGSIQWLDTNKKTHFRSELELMNLLSDAIQRTETEETKLRTWEDDQLQRWG